MKAFVLFLHLVAAAAWRAQAQRRGDDRFQAWRHCGNHQDAYRWRYAIITEDMNFLAAPT